MTDEYDRHDQFADNGLEQCPWCGEQIGGEGGYHEPVKDRAGIEYDHYTDSQPGTPLYHPDCWEEREAEKRADENNSLSDFA